MVVVGWVAISLAALVALWVVRDLRVERRERVPSWARKPRREKRPTQVYPSSLVIRDARLYQDPFGLRTRRPD
ncbi:MAG TPA: hypothetical protein VHE83_04960 [Mycobacteriales bacterium]|nr:hypothetical protein [Mycobacteriales bacterium]